jgi:hypothetical protein
MVFIAENFLVALRGSLDNLFASPAQLVWTGLEIVMPLKVRHNAFLMVIHYLPPN